MRDLARVWATIVAAVLQVAVPIAGYLGVLGRTAGAEFQTAKTPMVPATYAFGIWSLIFALCAVHAFEQARPSRRSDRVLRAIGWPMAGAMAVNAAWSTLAQFDVPLIGLAVVLAAGVAFALSALARLYRSQPRPAGWWRIAPAVGLLAGWVSLAVFANLSVALADLGWGDAPSRQAQAVLLLSGAGLLACATLWRLQAPWPYLAAVLWGLSALVVANLGREQAPTVAAVAAAWIAVAGLITALARRPRAAQ